MNGKNICLARFDGYIIGPGLANEVSQRYSSIFDRQLEIALSPHIIENCFVTRRNIGDQIQVKKIDRLIPGVGQLKLQLTDPLFILQIFE